MEPAIYTLIGVFLGGTLTFAYHLIDSYYNNKASRRKLIIDAAIDYWNKNCEIGLQLHKNSEKSLELSPLSAYIIFISRLMPLYEKSNLSDGQIKGILKKALNAEEIVESFYDKKKPARSILKPKQKNG